MKQSGQIILILIVGFALIAGIAVLIHWPGSRPLLEHVGAAVHGTSATARSDGTSGPALRARDRVAAMGPRWDAEAFAQTVSIYTAVHRDLEWPGLLEPETFRYGSDEQQTLDLFRPEQGFSEPGPVFVFVHGNGLGESDWKIPGSEGLLLTHAGRLAATAGGLGVLMNYRTGEPADAFSGAEDLRLVVEWIKENIAPYGGDPETIVVIGHSEGAAHLATYLFDESSQPEAGPGIAAAILSSGLFGDGAHFADLVEGFAGEAVPLALWTAEHDPALVRRNILAFHEQLCEKLRECPWHEELRGYNHMSQLLSLGTADTYVMNALIRFYHTVR